MSKCELCGEPMPTGEEVFKYHGYSGPCPKPPLPRPETELERLRKDAARYNWLAGKVFARGETCLALIEEFGGAPFKGETIRQFVDRYIDEAMTANVEFSGTPAALSPEAPLERRVGRLVTTEKGQAMAHDAHDWERQRLGGETFPKAKAPQSKTEPLISQATGKLIGCVQHDCAKCETDAEERRLLAALLREWYEMFAPCRREGTEGASLIDRTALMLQMTDMLKTANG